MKGHILVLLMTLSLVCICGCANADQTVKSDESWFFTTSDGVKLHYRVAGTGMPLVILPGFGQDAGKFDNVYNGLKEHFTIYTLDYRWLGKSDAPAYGHHIERLAADAKEMIEHEGIGTFYLFGHSMGNAVAWCYFSIYGQDKVMKYILGDQAPCLLVNPSWTDEEIEAYTGLYGNRDRQLYTPSPFLGRTGNDVRGDMLSKLMAEHHARDWRDVISTISIPTMVVIAGGAHFASPPLYAWFRNNLQNARVEVIDHARHSFYESHPDEFNKLALDYLSQTN